MAVYTLGGYKLGPRILDLETRFWTAVSLHSVWLQIRETDLGSVDVHASRGSFNVNTDTCICLLPPQEYMLRDRATRLGVEMR